jgi:hypothetical protein
MVGHVWEQFGSVTLHNRPADPNDPDPSDGGRGYYRNTTLLSAWATAPFLHNNAIGPEICGKPADKTNDFYYSPYVDASDKAIANPPPCWAYDPSVEGRFKLYRASMDQLLTPPAQRPRKVTLLNESIVIEAGPKFYDPVHRQWVLIRLMIPAGTPQAMVGNLLYKQLLDDMTLSVTDMNQLKAKLKDDHAANEVKSMLDEFLANLGTPLNVIEKHQQLVKKYYMTSTDFWENEGHPFGTGFSTPEKNALIAFVATL